MFRVLKKPTVTFRQAELLCGMATVGFQVAYLNFFKKPEHLPSQPGSPKPAKSSYASGNMFSDIGKKASTAVKPQFQEEALDLSHTLR